MPTLPAATALSNAANQGTAKTLFEDQLAAIKQLPGAAARSTLTISSDQITPTQFAHRLDTEGGAATDDLKNILQGPLPDGSLLLLSIVSASRPVKVWNAAGGTGQMTLKTGDHFWLGDPTHYLLLIRSGSTWEEIERFPAARFVPSLFKNSNYTVSVDDRGKEIISSGNDWTLTLLDADLAGLGFDITLLNGNDNGIVSIGLAGGNSMDHIETHPAKIHPREIIRLQSDGSTAWRILSRTSFRPPPGFLYGFTLSNSGADVTNDIVIAPGKAGSDNPDNDNRATFYTTASFIKQLDASWSAGSGTGGRISGESLVDGTWHVFAFRPLNGGTDFCFSQSLSPTLPSSGTHKRRIGSILRESGAIVAFFQDGRYFRRRTGILDLNVTNPGTSSVSRTLSVPSGINVMAFGNGLLELGATASVLFLRDLEGTDEAASTSASPLGNANTNSAKAGFFDWQYRTNTSRQIGSRLTASDGTVNLRLVTLGWWDDRGMFA